jgi:spore coat polysaccharide biosynthesis protein SpsF
MKIGFFITARLKSTRLKRKILLDLNGKSVLDRVIERTKQVNGIDGVVLCTSTNPQDSVLEKNATKNKIQFFKGSEDDVLDRLLSAAEHFGYDAFASITADNPLFSIMLAENAINNYRLFNADFIFIKNVPIGCASYFLDTKALKVANYMKNESDTEIWGPFVNRPDFFNIIEIKLENSPFLENKRLTCDYIEDHKLINEIYSELSIDKPDIPEIFKLLQKKPHLWDLNKIHKQNIPSVEVLKKINNEFDLMKNKGLEYAASINKILTPNFSEIKIKI